MEPAQLDGIDANGGLEVDLRHLFRRREREENLAVFVAGFVPQRADWVGACRDKQDRPNSDDPWVVVREVYRHALVGDSHAVTMVSNGINVNASGLLVVALSPRFVHVGFDGATDDVVDESRFFL